MVNGKPWHTYGSVMGFLRPVQMEKWNSYEFMKPRANIGFNSWIWSNTEPPVRPPVRTDDFGGELGEHEVFNT